MPYVRKASSTARTSSLVLAADGLTTASIPINSDWIGEISLRVSMVEGHGGIRFNLRLPAAAVAWVLCPFQWSRGDSNAAPILSLHEAGIGVNIGASAQDYFSYDNGGGACSGIIYGQIGLRNGANAGAATLEWANVRAGTGAVTLEANSFLIARQP